MGTSARSIAVTAALAALATLLIASQAAHAQGEPCVHTDAWGRVFPVCFDPGNRVLLSASTGGYGGELRVRHRLSPEPGIWWRLEHRALAAVASAERVRGVVYQGRYLRHARDGHIVFPLRPTKKVFLPFDVGAEAEVGRLDWRYADDAVDLGAVRAALLFELTRASHVRRRLAVGAVARWDMRLGEDVSVVRAHAVAPFSRALADAYVESRDGLTLAGLRVEAGTAWSSEGGWRESITAEANVERVLIALDDRPLALFVAGGYDGEDRGWRGEVGLRFALATWGAARVPDPGALIETNR